MTLREYRDRSGKTIPVILEELAATCPDAPTTAGGFLNIERRGVRRRDLIRALALSYGATEEEIANAETVQSLGRRGRRVPMAA